MFIRKFVSSVAVVTFVAAGLLLGSPAVEAGGVTGPAFYVDGVLYRTVGTPTDLSKTRAPLSSFDVIYAFPPNTQPNVATAAPGDPGYNGGRWQVHALSFNTSWTATVAAHDVNASGNLDSDEEIAAALADAGPGGAMDTGVVRMFECPVIKVPANQ